MTPVTNPFHPGGMEFLGNQPGVGGMSQLIAAMAYNAAPNTGNWAFNSVNADSNQVISAAAMVNGFYQRLGLLQGRSDTTDTAANIVAQIPGARIGQAFLFAIANLSGSTLTIVAGNNVTLAGTTTVLTVATRLYLASITACPVLITGMSYLNQVVTLTTNQPHGLAAAGNAIVANMPNNNFNGTFVISTVPDAYHLTYPLLTTALATDASIPDIRPTRPALLNTASTLLLTGMWAWDKATGTYA